MPADVSVALSCTSCSLTTRALQCRDCCCNSCNRGSSYCAFPRFSGEDIGDETRNFIFWMAGTGLLNFCLSYSIWANYGSPRMFLLLPALASTGLLTRTGLKMKWLMCHPVERPQNNLANWISMDALDTEHGRVALAAIGYNSNVGVSYASSSRMLARVPPIITIIMHTSGQ